jgi:restriction system protein
MGLEAIFKGWSGEFKTKFINSFFLSEGYRVFNNLIIQTKLGSTQIDHVIVSKYGLFAVETKDVTGWIYGNSDQDQWTKILFNKRYKLQNPLRQNYRHTKALSEFLGIDHDKIHSLVIFWGDCELKTQMPDNVCKGGIINEKFKRYIKSKDIVLLSPKEVVRICKELTAVKDNTGLFSSLQHTRELNNRYASKIKCPKCGGSLVKRVSTRSQMTFLGCSNYPRCHYTKELG